MSDRNGTTLELVVFKLRPGVSKEDFLSTNDAVSTWIGQQPGFVSHELLYDAQDDQWIELAWWKSLEDATAAADRAMTSETCAPMFSMIDTETMQMLHAGPATAPFYADAS